MGIFNQFESLADLFGSFAKGMERLGYQNAADQFKGRCEYWNSLAKRYGGLGGFLAKYFTDEGRKYLQEAKSIEDKIVMRQARRLIKKIEDHPEIFGVDAQIKELENDPELSKRLRSHSNHLARRRL